MRLSWLLASLLLGQQAPLRAEGLPAAAATVPTARSPLRPVIWELAPPFRKAKLRFLPQVVNPLAGDPLPPRFILVRELPPVRGPDPNPLLPLIREVKRQDAGDKPLP